MKIFKAMAGVTLLAVIAGTLTGCYVETGRRWRPSYHRPVAIVHVR
jgi:hypothetical protein